MYRRPTGGVIETGRSADGTNALSVVCASISGVGNAQPGMGLAQESSIWISYPTAPATGLQRNCGRRGLGAARGDQTLPVACP
jgi:hypothetical protein